MLYHHIGEFDMTDAACVGDPLLHPVNVLYESIQIDTKIHIKNILDGKYTACHLSINESEPKTVFCFHNDYKLKELLEQDPEYIGMFDASYGHLVSIGDNKNHFSPKAGYHIILPEALFYVAQTENILSESPYSKPTKERLKILFRDKRFVSGKEILETIGEEPVWNNLRFIPNNVLSLEIERNTLYSFNDSHIWKYGVASKICCTSLPVWVYKKEEQVVAIAVSIDGEPSLPKCEA